MTDQYPAARSYPDGYHVVNFLGNALIEMGADVQYDDDRLQGQEGFVVNGVPIVWLLDNRAPYNMQRQDPIARQMLADGEVMVLHCQQSDMERVGGRWLPIAATPRFAPANTLVDKLYDCGFVGYTNDEQRHSVMRRMNRAFSLCVAQGVFYEDAAAVYHESRVGINVPSLYGTGIDTDINMRVFEIMACGVPLVTNYNPALDHLGIRSGVNCLTYDNEDELHIAVQTLLDDPKLAGELAGNALKLVQAKHTYQHRAETLLEWIDEWQT